MEQKIYRKYPTTRLSKRHNGDFFKKTRIFYDHITKAIESGKLNNIKEYIDLSDLEVDELIKELSVVQAYVNDDGKDRIVAGDADIGIVYSGDALVMMDENPDLAYAIPEEGTNKWVDAMCIPKTAENKDYAEAFINFMLDPEVAKQNVDYIEYSTPNQGVYDMLDEETKNSPVAYPSEKVLNKTEVFLNLPENVMKLYDDAWTEIKTN